MLSGVRRGGWLWGGYRVCGWSLLILILLLAGLRAYGQLRYRQASHIFVAAVGPLEVERYQPPALLDSYWLTDGVLAVDLGLGAGRQRSALRHLAESPGASWKPRERRRLRQLLDRNRAALDVLHAAAGRRLQVGLDPAGAEAFAPPLDLRAFPRAARLLQLEGRWHFDAGRVPQATVSALALASLADALLREPLVECQQVGAAVEERFLELLSELLPVAGEEELHALREGLEQLQPAVPALRRSLGAEATVLLHRLVGQHGRWSTGELSEDGRSVEGPATDGVAPAGHFELVSDGAAAATGADGDQGSGASIPPSTHRRLATVDGAERTFFRWTQELQLATLLDRYTRLVRTAERPYALLAQSLSGQGRSAASRWLLADLLAPELGALIERVQVTASARQLATAAVEVRLAGFEREAGESTGSGWVPARLSPYTAEPVVVRRTPDGTLELVYPRAEQLWRRRRAGGDRPPPLRWPLPPP